MTEAAFEVPKQGDFKGKEGSKGKEEGPKREGQNIKSHLLSTWSIPHSVLGATDSQMNKMTSVV